MENLQTSVHAVRGAPLNADQIAAFRASLRGPVVAPNDPDYEAVRGLWNGMIDRCPAVIARCTGVADVVEAVHFARTNGLPLAVRGGGHNVAGTASCDAGVMLDLSLMRGVHVDLQARTARVQGGALWGDVDRETQLYGLATAGGVVSTTGVAGLTLNGGLGWLRRVHGLTVDNLLEVEIVTADGEVRTASETENTDLLWAVRGGGGNFGVVTSFVYRLHPVGPMVYLCAPMYAAESETQVKRMLRTWRDFAREAPDVISGEAMFWSVPDAPDFPEEARLQPVVAFPAAYIGPVEEGERILQPLREMGTPLVDLSHPMPYAVLQSAFDPIFPKGTLRYYWKSLYLNGLDDEVIDALVPRAVDRPSPNALVAIWQLGGAMSRVSADATAFGRRDAPLLLSFDTTWADPQDDARNIEWTRAFWRDMQAFSPGGVYLNFPGFGEEADDLVRAAYGTNYDRLTRLKHRYDPDNLFRINQNIQPAAAPVA